MPCDSGNERVGLLARVHQRLVAHDMKSGFDEGQRHRKMHMIRRDDRDEIDALVDGAFQLISKQGLPVAMVAVVRKIKVVARRPGLRGAGRQRSADQFSLPVERNGAAVDGADERIAATAHHGVAQLAMR